MLQKQYADLICPTQSHATVGDSDRLSIELAFNLASLSDYKCKSHWLSWNPCSYWKRNVVFIWININWVILNPALIFSIPTVIQWLIKIRRVDWRFFLFHLSFCFLSFHWDRRRYFFFNNWIGYDITMHRDSHKLKTSELVLLLNFCPLDFMWQNF